MSPTFPKEQGAHLHLIAAQLPQRQKMTYKMPSIGATDTIAIPTISITISIFSIKDRYRS